LSRGVLPTVVHHCVWSRNLVNEEALAHWGTVTPKKQTNKLLLLIGIFHWHNPSGCTMALGLTQPLTEMSTTYISWGVKAASV